MPIFQLTQYQTQTEPVLATPDSEKEARWHQPWSDPRQTIARKSIVGAFIAVIGAGSAGYFAPVLEPETEIIQNFESRWHQPWSEPVWLKIAPQRAIALTASGPFAPVLDTAQIIDNYESRWHQPWSVPVRLKRGLATQQQRLPAQDTDWIPHPNEYLEAWYARLSEPVWPKKGLRAALRPAFTAPTRIIPNPITVILAATETNADVAEFAINIYDSSTSTSGSPTAKVSVTEIRSSGDTPVSISES